MNYILFDDKNRKRLLPLTFTRPGAELRIGILTIREKWERYLNSMVSYHTEKYLSEKFPFQSADNNLFINGTVLPNQVILEEIQALENNQALYNGDVLIAVRLNKEQADAFNPSTFTASGVVETKSDNYLKITYPFDLFRLNKVALEEDFYLLTKGRVSQELDPSNRIVGDINKIFIEEGAKVECSILNTNDGSIYIGKNAEIMEGCIIRGGLALCEGSALKMGSKIYGATTIGPHSKVGGEVNNTVILGYSNKAHDGFLGNSVIGEWCNLGADTNNSNLKNNYAEVRVWDYETERFIKTGLQFCGLIMGDHSKSGINTMFNTGTVVGVAANIFGAGFPRNFVPSFSWGGSAGYDTFQLPKVYEMAEIVFSRRGLEFNQTEKNILSEVFHLSESYRFWEK